MVRDPYLWTSQRESLFRFCSDGCGSGNHRSAALHFKVEKSRRQHQRETPRYLEGKRCQFSIQWPDRSRTLILTILSFAHLYSQILRTPIYPDEQYYVGIFLTTVVHEKTGCRYFHPYELEDIKGALCNAADKCLWYPIAPTDSDAIQRSDTSSRSDRAWLIVNL